MGGAAKTADFARLFLVPGMGHSGGGEGPNSFDVVNALEQWVEKGTYSRAAVAKPCSVSYSKEVEC